MVIKAFYFAAAMALCGSAFAQGYPAAGPPNDNTVFFVCQPSTGHPCSAGQPWTELFATMPDLANYIASKLPTLPANVSVVIVQGNNTGTYTVPGIAATNKLLMGYSLQDNLATAAYNWSPSNFTLVSNLVNTTNGWKTAAGQIVDPTATDWSNFNLIWLYE